MCLGEAGLSAFCKQGYIAKSILRGLPSKDFIFSFKHSPSEFFFYPKS